MRGEKRGILAWFASNHVAANILMFFLLALGALSLIRITLEVFPDIGGDTVTVRVPYLGASPAEVEEAVCMRVEEAIAGVEGIKRLRSVANEGVGTVFAELQEDTDVSKALDDIKAEVDRIETFPAETEKPVISETSSRRQVITVVIYGDVGEKTIKNLAEEVRDELTAKDNISQADLAGIRRFEISIEVSEETLRKHGLRFSQVADLVRRTSLDLPGGSVKTAGGEILIRTKGQRYRGPEFRNIEILTRPDGTRLYLDDIATIIDGFEDSDTLSRFDGKRAAQVQVYRIGKQDALEVADTVKQYVEEKRNMLPNGVGIDTWQDDSRILRSRINLLLRNAQIGLILVFICLALFLDLRLAFWTTMGIPISFLGAFWLIPMFGVTLNMISLFAFIVSLGLVVDDAIVVGENIFNYRKEGMEPLNAAIKGVTEMFVPVTFAILTTVVAFMPLLFTAGNIGKIMRNIPIVVISVLMISLVEACLILPAHLSGKYRVRKPGVIAQFQNRVRNGLERFVNGFYANTLEKAITWRYISLAIALAIFLTTIGYIAGGHIKFTFMPKIDADNMVALLTMPQGTPLEQTEAIVHHLEETAEKVRQEFDANRGDNLPSVFRHMSSTIGEQPSTRRSGPMASSAAGSTSTSHLAEINVELLSAEDRNISSVLMANRWRELSGEVPGAVSLVFTASLFTAGEAINVELSHRDFDVLLTSVNRLKETLSQYSGVSDIGDSFLPGKKELKLTLKREGQAAGLTWSDLARQVRQGFYGEEAQRIQRGRDDVRVMVRYPQEERKSRADIENMRIRLPNGKEVPFNTVAEVHEGQGYATVNRTDRRRVVSVTADVDDAVANSNEINQDLRVNVLPQLVQDYQGLMYSFEGMQREQRDSLGTLLLNFVVSQIAIFALLAIPLRRYVQPVIIMSAIPFGIVGAVLGHIVMGYNMSMLSMFGIVALTGVVVNDSLIMTDLINRQRDETDLPLHQIIVNSGTRRFRPIMLTTLTTFFGLAPMILESSLQAKFLIPMAISLGFGVVFATAISLLLVPVLYSILEDFKSTVYRLTSGGTERAGHSSSKPVTIEK